MDQGPELIPKVVGKRESNHGAFSLWSSTSSISKSHNEGSGGAILAWKDVSVEVVSWKGESKSVVQGLSGYVEPGQLMAIMGPSGSGKTTMLDALSGRLPTNTVQTGMVRLNGHKKRLSYGKAAYVTQDDHLLGTLTVRESVWYSVEARLASDVSYANKQALVDAVILEMGLQDCANTHVGNWHIRGISNGEKRRLSIAIEILLHPCLLFLDEPTSGLDSASSFFVTRTLSNLARGGRTVIASIHQPSSDVFQLFDTLYLLAGGKTIYFGKVSEACNFFAKCGFPCPPLRNPSDHFLRCINAEFDRVKETLKRSSRKALTESEPQENHHTTEIIEILIESYKDSTYASTATSKLKILLERKGTQLESCGSKASLVKQSMTLTRRSFTNMTRDMGYYWLRLVIYIIVSVCVGTIYYNVGTSYHALYARGSCGAFMFGFVTFMSIGGFPSFVEDMKVFHKERLNGHYEVISFVMGHTLSSTPFLLLIAIISSSISYFMVGLHPGFVHFLYFMLLLFLSLSVVEGLMMAIASVVPNFLMGIIIGAGIQGMFMLVAGYFRLPNDIPKPVWKYPITYIAFDYWAIQGQSQNDLHGLVFEDQNGVPNLQGDSVLRQVFEIDTNRSKWWDLSVILAMVFIYRIIFFICIKLNEDVTPWVKGYLAKKSLERKKALMHRYSGEP